MAAEQCLIALGANLGDPPARLRWAVEQLGNRLRPQRLRVSPFYRSAPIGPPGQADYCNAVCEMWLEIRPTDLLQTLKQVESDAGRDFRRPRWSARELDLDILLMGTRQIDSVRLKVPHPRMNERNFVLVPLLDLLPEARIPGHGLARDLLRTVGKDGLERWPAGV